MNNFNGITIGSSRSANFENDVVEALEKIQSAPSGNSLLREISRLSTSEKKVTIFEGSHSTANVALPQLTPSKLRKLEQKNGGSLSQQTFDKERIRQSTGTTLLKKRGCASIIGWSKSTATPLLSSSGVPVPGTSPSIAFITLAHELVHAKHHLAGTGKYGGQLTPDPSSASTESGLEELRATGLGRYANSEPSENSIRRELGMPLRKKYAQSGAW